MKYREKVSAKDILRVNINVQLYCWYTSTDELKEWACRLSQEEAPWEMHIDNKDLETLMKNVAGQVILGQRIIKPFYNIELVEGPMPMKKEGVVQYTGKPPAWAKGKALEYLLDEKEELADKLYERRAYS